MLNSCIQLHRDVKLPFRVSKQSDHPCKPNIYSKLSRSAHGKISLLPRITVKELREPSGSPKALMRILEQEKLGNMKEGWHGQFKKRILSTKGRNFIMSRVRQLRIPNNRTIVKQDNPGRRSEMIHEGRDESGLLNEDCRVSFEFFRGNAQFWVITKADCGLCTSGVFMSNQAANPVELSVAKTRATASRG
ncbi:hypothetical protein B0H17DRAFT_1123884 [Mycena rosella]|uniref:Uncharacterized protein n=1 Tax=Mycena rosella TaxID=1033263 RepID=A0AAD7H383_MYCRO|nr:hypothetical protein B0H17DRAFT_1123884 [Mycena rosella]